MAALAGRLGSKLRRALAGDWRLELFNAINGSPARGLLRAGVDLVHARSKARRRTLGREAAAGAPAALAARLARDGWAMIDEGLDPPSVAALLAAAAALPAETGGAAGGANAKEFWTFPLEALEQDGMLPFDSPFVRFALQPALVGAAARYLGELPYVAQVLAMRTHYTGEPWKISQLWHVDYDDARVLKVFVYLSDVATEADGPFTFVPRSAYRGIAALGGRRLTDTQVLAEGTAPHRVLGPAGTAFFIDTSRCYHMGSRVEPGHGRLAMSVTYVPGPSMNPAAVNRIALPSNADEATRLLLRGT